IKGQEVPVWCSRVNPGDDFVLVESTLHELCGERGLPSAAQDDYRVPRDHSAEPLDDIDGDVHGTAGREVDAGLAPAGSAACNEKPLENLLRPLTHGPF